MTDNRIEIENQHSPPDDKQKGKVEELKENLLMWVIRYVMIPIVLTSIAGFFAIAVVDRTFHYENGQPAVPDTMTATATEAQPTSELVPTQAATAVPTNAPPPTPEPNTANKQPVTAVPPVSQPTLVCIAVPIGWQLYTVQPGNTLFSLARESGTTVELIRQVNCLYGELLAYSQIWLPGSFFDQPAEPIIITPTITVTEPIPLPDIAIGAIDGEAMDCYPDCEPLVPYTVSNLGAARAGAFTIQITFSFGDPVNGPQQLVAGLEPGEQQTLYLPTEPLITCYYYGCQISINGDSGNEIVEENESNNDAHYTFTGYGGRIIDQSDQ